MKTRLAMSVASILVLAGTASAFAQTQIDQRLEQQQQWISRGAASGQLTPHEVQRLENGEQHVLDMKNRAAADGRIDPREARRLDGALDREGRAIRRESHDGQTVGQPGKGGWQGRGAPSLSGLEQRQIDQQRRIANGVASGQLTQRETQRLERGEQRISRMEQRAAADGRVSPQERRQIQGAETRESRQIWRETHDAQRR
jgi:uncharacterized membrane protein YebE (DUF533 family)